LKCNGKTKWIPLGTTDHELALRKLKEEIVKYKKTDPKASGMTLEALTDKSSGWTRIAGEINSTSPFAFSQSPSSTLRRLPNIFYPEVNFSTFSGVRIIFCVKKWRSIKMPPTSRVL